MQKKNSGGKTSEEHVNFEVNKMSIILKTRPTLVNSRGCVTKEQAPDIRQFCSCLIYSTFPLYPVSISLKLVSPAPAFETASNSEHF